SRTASSTKGVARSRFAASMPLADSSWTTATRRVVRGCAGSVMTEGPPCDAAPLRDRLHEQLFGGAVAERNNFLADLRRHQSAFRGILLDRRRRAQLQPRFGQIAQEFGLLIENPNNADSRRGRTC